MCEPKKTQVSVFHLRNKDVDRSIKVLWNDVALVYSPNPVYLGVTLDRTPSYREHIMKTKAKIGTRNNLLNKLVNTKWGANATTLRTSALSLCYSVAEYACVVWERSAHAYKINPALNNACRRITGCLKPTDVNSLHILAGIAPPEIRRAVASRVERSKQTSDPRHLLYGRQKPVSRLKSRHSFLSDVLPLQQSAELTRLEQWRVKMSHIDKEKIPCEISESLPSGHMSDRESWITLNRLRVGVGKRKVERRRWGFLEEGTNILCECGEDDESIKHLLQCRLSGGLISKSDLASYNEKARLCVQKWKGVV